MNSGGPSCILHSPLCLGWSQVSLFLPRPDWAIRVSALPSIRRTRRLRSRSTTRSAGGMSRVIPVIDRTGGAFHSRSAKKSLFDRAGNFRGTDSNRRGFRLGSGQGRPKRGKFPAVFPVQGIRPRSAMGKERATKRLSEGEKRLGRYLSRLDQPRRLVPLEKIEQQPQGAVFVASQPRVPLEHGPRLLARPRQQPAVDFEPGKSETGRAAWRAPSTSPSPRRRRSSSAMRNPSSVDRSVSSRVRAVSPSGPSTGGGSSSARRRARRGRAAGGAGRARSARRARRS